MDQNEVKYDKLLKIKTTGRDDSRSDQYCYPYEPTPYGVLERLAYCGYLGKKNHLIDYGCGKGRVDFFLAWQVRCRTTGVEYDERMTKAAEENRQRAVSGTKTSFILENAFSGAGVCRQILFFQSLFCGNTEKRHRTHPGILV